MTLAPPRFGPLPLVAGWLLVGAKRCVSVLLWRLQAACLVSCEKEEQARHHSEIPSFTSAVCTVKDAGWHCWVSFTQELVVHTEVINPFLRAYIRRSYKCV